MSSLKNNYARINRYVEDTKAEVNKTKAWVCSDKKQNWKTVSEEMRETESKLKQKYSMNAETVKSDIVNDWKQIIESQKLVRSESECVENEVRHIEARFRKAGGNGI